ncbi:MAG: phytoene/squalene synthase family protein, partial [Planctomycetaceae bacterium]|nr:phytoene/squalene synthase family protein [Planctomycetaceae bacterium]
EPVDHPVLPALADIVERHAIPHQYLFDVLDGIATDLEPVSFETFEELSRYCYHVAGAVGLCCIHIWGFREPAAIERAIDCGLAFQLTNILRDLGEDAGMGRVYLPREDLRRFGYSVEELSAGVRNGPFLQLMEFQVSRAEALYQRAGELYSLLEPPGQPILASMLQIYGGLLASIRERKFDVFSRRVSLPRWKKLWIAFGSLARHRWPGRTLLNPPRDW